ncbi:hypothetical protein [Ralstonia pseudosolanacearum]|uniref:hypothetical protein n=1 Tax=Ralstonia pseudosolanacearum TaxID=1310165 RepID=UPI001FFC2A24|nr:hypothetical protein [Ralstonia pseudosolanacearum]
MVLLLIGRERPMSRAAIHPIIKDVFKQAADQLRMRLSMSRRELEKAPLSRLEIAELV